MTKKPPLSTTGPPLTAEFLLYGAFHAAHQAWHLLEDAVTLFRCKSYPTSLALSVFSLEEVGRAKYYLEQRHAVLTRQTITVDILTSRQAKDHVWKLMQADIPVSVGLASCGTPPLRGSRQEAELAERLRKLRKAVEEQAPKRAHEQRLSALYVDPDPNVLRWRTPARMIRKEEADEKLGAADLAYTLFRLRVVDPKEGSELAFAIRRLHNLPKLPEPYWDEWTWGPKELE